MSVGVWEGIATKAEAKFEGGTAHCTLFSDSCQKRKVGLRSIQICLTTWLSLYSNSEYLTCILK